ncbi:MAG: F0F1 ATP synthase subunit delta [Acidimicrobiales bacterium]
MHISLRGYATAVISELTGDQIGRRVADDLTAVAHLVSRTNALALVMTDFTVPVPARKAVLDDLLRSRVHPAALRLALRSVESERAEELPTSLHELYELALHLDALGPAELLAEEPIATRGRWRDFASGYASAVFEEVADTSELEEIEDEIFHFARIVESHPSLRSALSDPTRPIEDRAKLVNGLLEGKVRPATLRIVQISLQGRVRDVVGALDWLAERAASARGWRVARVHTARPVDDTEHASLAEAMRWITGYPVELHISEDPDLLGGAVIEVGDLFVDASASHRLEILEEHLLGHEGATTGAAH